MTRLLLAVGVLGLGVTPTLADDAKAIIEKAIKAAGWAKDAPTAVHTWTDKGKFTGGGMAAEYTGEWAFAGPDKYRFTVKMKLGEQPFELSVIANGDAVYEAAFGMSRLAAGEKREYVRGQVYRLWVQSLLPLLSDKEFNLKQLPEIKIGDAAAVGVEVTRKDKPAVKLYFDAKTGLMVKSEMMTKNEFDGWKETLSEAFIGGWTDAGGGRKAFTTLRIAVAGKTQMESELSDAKIDEKYDLKKFDIPDVRKGEPKKDE